MADEIAIHAISTRARIGPSEWDQSAASNELQPVLVSLWTPYNLQLAGGTDNLDHSLNYAAVCKTIEKCFDAAQVFTGPQGAAERVAAACFAAHPTLTQIRLRVEMPRAALRAKSIAVEIERHRLSHVLISVPDVFIVTDLELDALVGVNNCERADRQRVIINLRIEPGSAPGNFFSVSKTVREVSAVRDVFIRGDLFSMKWRYLQVYHRVFVPYARGFRHKHCRGSLEILPQGFCPHRET